MKHRFVQLILISLFSLHLYGLAYADPSDTSKTTNSDSIGAEISLDQLIAIAFEDNPRLKTARLNWEAMIERFPQETALDDPMFQFGYFIESVETRVGPQNRQYAIVQKFPFPGKLKTKGKIVSKRVEIARVRLEQVIREVIAELKDAYYELLYLEKAIEITRQNKDLVEHLAKLAKTDYDLDGTTLNDVFKAESQRAQLSYDLILLTEFRETQITRINGLLNRLPETPLGSPSDVPDRALSATIEDLYQMGRRHQEGLRMAGLEIAQRAEEVHLAELDALPNFKLGVGYTEIGESIIKSAESGKDAYKVNVGITLPLWFEKNRARVKEAKLRRQAAAFRREALERRLLTEIKTVYFKLQNAERQIQLYRGSLIPQAQQSIETAETWYKEKKGSFSGLLEMQAVWLNFNLALQRSISNHQQYLAKLERLIGRNLEVRP